MKAFDPNYKLLDEMYQDDYYPAFLVDKVKDELQKVIDLLESGETDTEVIQETLDEAVCGINDLIFLRCFPQRITALRSSGAPHITCLVQYGYDLLKIFV